jgi:hypothetical protein
VEIWGRRKWKGAVGGNWRKEGKKEEMGNGRNREMDGGEIWEKGRRRKRAVIGGFVGWKDS